MRPSDASQAREAILLLALAGFNAGISLRCVEPMLPKLAEEFGAFDYAPAIAAFGLGWGLLGYWLRSNLDRFRP